MIRLITFILLLVIPMVCSGEVIDEYRGEIGGGGGESSLGQSAWRYQSGNSIVYGGDAGRIYYLVFSEASWASLKAFDYSPNSPIHKQGGFELITDGNSTFFPFQDHRLLLLIISKDLSVRFHYISVTMEEWRAFMQPYTNRLNDSDYHDIKNYFEAKSQIIK